MAAPMSDASSSAPSDTSSQKRVNWTVATTEALICIWQDKLPALRSNTRNLQIYKSMVETLNSGLPAGEGPYSVKQVRQKLENLNRQYRKLRRCGTTTGAKGIEWPFYWQLHSFLGSLPINDSDLIEESLEVPVVDQAPAGSELVATYPTEEGESAATADPAPIVDGDSTVETEAQVAEPSASSTSSKKKSKKRPASAMLHDLVALHEKAEERAAKAASDSLELKKELVALQKESNNLQKGMLQMMSAYFSSKKAKE
ncbi:hypothetical protein HPB50_007530 [Hyalomma asiaticum]|uniref:Uncharacterized protein n=1 Tax=Hyalomma asiaticum TaxID=266040 RepID=A0ACB7SLV7_HYAAI|nr:hypothetical protein HPB50_007530 [Hyalomma asiaticum]